MSKRSNGVLVTPNGTLVLTSTGILLGYPALTATTSPTDLLFSFTNSGNIPPAAVDTNGNIYAATGTNAVTEFSPPSYNVTRTIAYPDEFSGAFSAQWYTVDSFGTVYIAALNSVTIAPVTGSASVYTAPSINSVDSVAYDPSGNAIVGTSFGVVVLTPKATVAKTITNGVAIGQTSVGFAATVAVDSGADIFVANSGGNTVTIYELPYTTAPITITMPNGYVPQSVTLGP